MKKLAIPVLLSIAVLGTAPAQQTSLVKIMKDELDRSFRVLREKADPAPYFISYAITDQKTSTMSATLGALVSDTQNHSRLLDVSVRVGDYKLDNYHRLRGQQGSPASGALTISLDDDPDSLKASLWSHTDRKYRQAAERLIRIKTNRAVKVEEEDASDDFSKDEPSAATSPLAGVTIPDQPWVERSTNKPQKIRFTHYHRRNNSKQLSR